MAERAGPDPHSGLDESGEWAPAFEGQRPPLDGKVDGLETRFAPGHTLSIRHGAYADLHLGSRADELAGQIREQLIADSLYAPGFELAIARLGIVWVRIERAQQAIDAVDAASRPGGQYNPEADRMMGLQRLRDDLKGWIRLAGRIEESLGLTTESRAKLGLDLALTGAARQRLSLQQHAALQAEAKHGD